METCIRDPSLIDPLNKIGYTKFIVEFDPVIEKVEVRLRRRLTFRGSLESKRLLQRDDVINFLKPLERAQLIKALNDKKVHGISIDKNNFHLLKKNLLNLVNIKEKYIEINLNNSTSQVIRRAIEWGHKGTKIVFSSCASKISEIWPPLSLFNYLVLHGASIPDIITWINTYPLELFEIVSDYS
uniref:RNase P subunit p30 n=1 Tax=Metallosphaera hakonensis JCM 8857 = DSM 7519 TaxID=1293036 RepID=A0A2U9IU94_9CREN